MNSKLFRLFAMLVVFSMIVSPVFAQVPVPPTTGQATAGDKFQTVSPDEVINLGQPATYIVLFEGSSLVAAHGGAAGLDAKSADSQAYLNTLAAARESILAEAQATLGRKLEISHVYDVILNGVAVKLTPEEAATLEGVPGVRKVLRDTIEYLDTDAGPTWIGAPTLWDGTAVPDGTETYGEGIIAGILDSGINFDHPSFSDDPDDGYVYPAPAKYLGVCDATNLAQYDPLYDDACNDKVIGAYTYTEDAASELNTPEDSDGHGSHTASTVVGNFVDIDFYGTPLTISGVAPHAQVISYDVCYPSSPSGACEGSDSVAAVQQAILDGVDVINFSISGGSNPYSDAVELAFLEAFDANIVVSTSAGNSGPTAATVGHRGPWLLTTAATTHDRKFTSEVNFSDPLYQGIYSLAGEIPFTTDVVDSPVKWSNDDNSNLLGCVAFTPGFFTGSIALIQRGTCNFSVKINFAAAAGATGVLIYTDTRAPGPMSVTGTTIPAVMLDVPGTTGTAIGNWIHGATSPTVSISAFGAVYDDTFGDIMGSFSSRGPTTTLDVLKPDVGAPGVEILAAVADNTIAPDGVVDLNLYQGTSMASPHDAGSAALLKALHPTWTPAMIKSALMLTAYDTVLKEDKVTPATPFDIGSGRIALQLAGLTGLVMNETYDNFVAADPALGGDVKTLNIASLYNSQCVGECSWTRTFTSVSGKSATYTAVAPAWMTVTPANFTIAKDATQVVTFTADVSAFAQDVWQFATIEFNTDDTHLGSLPVSDVHIPLAVLPTVSNLPDLVKFQTHRDNGADTLSDLVAVELDGLTVDTYGWVKGVQTTFALAEDPTNSSAYDDLSQVYYTIIPMDAGAARVVAEITASTAPDVDMWWGFDVNGDGMPQSTEQYEASATGSAFEYLSDWGFPVGFYDVWVLVENWAGSGAPTDDITLSIGVVPYAPVAPVTMTIDGPDTNPAIVPFSLDIYWHDIDTEEGDRLYGLADVYADPAYATNIGTMEMDVIRRADDVVKTADVTTAELGDTITYTIEINNLESEPYTYTILDEMPDGVTYVPDSVTGGATYDPVSNTINWSGLVDPPGAPYYVVSDSETDPLCDTGFGGYVNLAGFGIYPQSAITGDGTAWTLSPGTIPFNFYGVNYPTISFTDDGIALFDVANNWLPATDISHQDIPDADLPNALAAILWQDMEIVYAVNTKGVSIATAGPDVHIIEYDDVQVKGIPTSTYDFEIVYTHTVYDDPGWYEIVFAYDNIIGPLNASTIGVENAGGLEAAPYAYNDANFTDGHMVCFDLYRPASTVTITFQVVVDELLAATLTNTAVHDNSALGSLPEEASVTIGLTATSGYPAALDDMYYATANAMLDVPALTGVMANDIFAVDDGHSVSLVTETVHGIVTLYADGSFIYTPEPGYVGVDTFVYELVTYPSGLKAPWVDQATVTITVNPLVMYFPVIAR